MSPKSITGELILSTFTQVCQTQQIRLPHIEEEEEFDTSTKTSPEDENEQIQPLPKDVKNSVIRLKQIRTIFNPNTLVTKTTAYPPSTSSSSSSKYSSNRHLGFTSSIKLNRLLKRGIIRGTTTGTNTTTSTDNNTSSSTQTAQAQSHQGAKYDSATAACLTHVAQASPARMQAEQGSIGDLQKYHSRYLKNRRHTLANVR